MARREAPTVLVHTWTVACPKWSDGGDGPGNIHTKVVVRVVGSIGGAFDRMKVVREIAEGTWCFCGEPLRPLGVIEKPVTLAPR